MLSVYPQFALSMPSVCFRYSGAQEYIRISAGHAFFLCLRSAVLPVFLLESVGNRNSRDGYSGDRGNGGDNDDHSLHI